MMLIGVLVLIMKNWNRCTPEKWKQWISVAHMKNFFKKSLRCLNNKKKAEQVENNFLDSEERGTQSNKPVPKIKGTSQ